MESVREWALRELSRAVAKSWRVYLGVQNSAKFLQSSCQVSHFIKAFKWITFLVSTRMCCRFHVQVHQVGLRFSFRLKLYVLSRDEDGIGQGQPAPATQSNATGQRGELVVDDVVVLELLLQLLDILKLHHQA